LVLDITDILSLTLPLDSIGSMLFYLSFCIRMALDDIPPIRGALAPPIVNEDIIGEVLKFGIGGRGRA
jgi:hypothetical protein